MAASLTAARLGLFFTVNSVTHISKRSIIRPPLWLTGYATRREKRKPDVHPWEEKTLEERLKELYPKDEVLDQGYDIGETPPKDTRTLREKRDLLRANRKNAALEQAARHKTLKIPLDEVKSGWLEENGITHQYQIAKHYGIYDHLFNGSYFMPLVQLNVSYDYDDEFITPVYRGNEILPSEASSEPCVDYEADADKFYTLLMTNPDGHLVDPNGEYLHWMIGNIPGNDISKGDVLCDYLLPFPTKGTGLHRMVFVLFKQEATIDFSDKKLPSNCTNLQQRSFSTYEFYKKYASEMIPVGLSFFQTQWDESVRDTFHNVLDMGEPRYEFIHPPPYHPPQAKYPRNQPFDRYYDRYRDKKDLAEEVLRMKLKEVSPFKPRDPPSKYALIHRSKTYKPSWLKNREELMHRRIEQFKDL